MFSFRKTVEEKVLFVKSIEMVKLIEKDKDTIPMSLVGSEQACSNNSLIILRGGTPQCDEEQQQICAKLRNIYRVSQKKRGPFGGLWRRIEPLDHRKLNFSVQPRV